MKFKPTIAKSVLSILSGIVAFFLSTKIFARPSVCIPELSNPEMQICTDFAPAIWPLVILIVIITYFIWSLATKKKE